MAGCNLSENLCDNDESCYPDGVFGQCYSSESGSPEPTVLNNLDDTQLELLKLELTRLAAKEKDWGDEETQCVLAYFKMSMFYQLQYDPDFCQVRKPANVWALIQLIDTGLSEDPTLLDEEVNPENVTEEEMAQIIEQLKEPSLPTEEDIEEALNAENEDVDDEILDQYVQAVVNNENPDFSELSDGQLNSLIGRLVDLKKNVENEETEMLTGTGEQEMAVPLDDLEERGEQAILKKDIEQVGEVNQGLDNTEHKIVKGRKDQVVTRVDANRVYLKVHLKNEDQLMPLIEFLQNTIAIPNNLYFDDFQFENGQLSMRISRFEGAKPKAEKRIDSVEGVASATNEGRISLDFRVPMFERLELEVER
uniref:Lipoprotein n=1 Tax=Caenorhabditis tropicalis TaxID=1561998 RepID=A0A1I7T0I6_9PELO